MKQIEKAVVILIALIGFGILILSLVSMYNDLSTGKPPEYYVVDFLFFSFSLVLIGGGVRLYKRILAYEALTDVVLDELLYDRLKPLLEQVAFSTAEIDEVKTKLSEIESEIRNIEERVVKVPGATPGETLLIRKITFYVKTVMVAMFFFGIYLFMINFVLPYEVFLYVFLYVIWWVFITGEFNIFDKMDAWVILCIPILIVPSAAIVLNAVFGIVTARVVVFWTALLYAYLYYRYARKIAVQPKEEEWDFSAKAREIMKKILK